MRNEVETNGKSRTARMECAFSVASFFNTRSTACTDVSFWNFSRIVAAVKSAMMALSPAPDIWNKNDSKPTSQSLLIAVQGLESGCAPVESLDVIRVLAERIVAVCHDPFVLRRSHVHVTCEQDS